MVDDLLDRADDYVVPHLGTFHGQSVGNTAHTTGYDVSFHREGEERAENGLLRFLCRIEGNAIVWRYAENDNRLPKSWPTPAVMAHALIYAESLRTRDPVGFMFQVMGAAEMEREKLRTTRGNIQQHIDNYTNFLADPREPKSQFIKGSDRYIPASPTYRAFLRGEWRRNLEQAKQRFAEHEAQYGERIIMLDRLIGAIHEWCHRKPAKAKNTDILAVIDNALAFEPAE